MLEINRKRKRYIKHILRVRKILNTSTWAVFYEEGPVIRMQELETRIVTEWLPKSGYEYANAPEIELYLNPDPDNTKYEIWLPIVRKEEVQ